MTRAMRAVLVLAAAACIAALPDATYAASTRESGTTNRDARAIDLAPTSTTSAPSCASSPLELATSDADVRETTIQAGGSISLALRALGIRANDMYGVIRAFRPAKTLDRATAGQQLRVLLDDGGKLVWLRHRRDASATVASCAERDREGRFAIRSMSLPIELRTAVVAGPVSGSLVESIRALGEDPTLAAMLADLFGGSENLLAPRTHVDAFHVLIAKRFVDGQFADYERILAAEYVNGETGRTHRAFFFETARGEAAYFDEEGTPIARSAYASPVRLGEMTSGYGKRKHPILRYRRAHKGMDFSAPRGTHVYAVHDGVVAFARYRRGLGKTVDIEHENGLTTRYAHLDTFAANLRVGDRVREGALIGYVGRTGLATGPHLHFEALIDGVQFDPESLSFASSRRIGKRDLEKFRAMVFEALDLLHPKTDTDEFVSGVGS